MATDERVLDTDIISNVARAIINDADGMNTLISAAGNTPDPAKGVAQYLMMLIDSINSLLEQAGVPFDMSVIGAKGGVVDSITPDIESILKEAGIPVDASFGPNLLGMFLEMVKAGADAADERTPQGSTLTGEQPLLEQVGGMP